MSLKIALKELAIGLLIAVGWCLSAAVLFLVLCVLIPGAQLAEEVLWRLM